jgi:hypothetical protein
LKAAQLEENVLVDGSKKTKAAILPFIVDNNFLLLVFFILAVSLNNFKMDL